MVSGTITGIRVSSTVHFLLRFNTSLSQCSSTYVTVLNYYNASISLNKPVN